MGWTGTKQASVAVIPADATLYFAPSVRRSTQVVAQRRWCTRPGEKKKIGTTSAVIMPRRKGETRGPW